LIEKFFGVGPLALVSASAGLQGPFIGRVNRGDHIDRPIGINLSPNPGCCRGEGGWVDAGWAFRVARGACWPFIGEPASAGEPQRATLKAHPSPLHHLRPYGW